MPDRFSEKQGGADPLCCCEYINIDGERSHILAVCCDCEAIDDTCDRWIKRMAVPESNYSKMWSTIADRLRIPWLGGAVRCEWEIIIPVMTIPVLMLISTTGQMALFASLIIVGLVIVAARMALRNHQETKFYYLWTKTSFLTLFLAFEVLVVPMLKISFFEHLIFAILLSVALICWFKVRANRGFCAPPAERAPPSAPAAGEGGFCEVCASPRPERAFHCATCGRCVRLRDHHCVWLDCCVGGANQRPFVAGLLSVAAALLLAVQLTLGSVCYCLPVLGGALLLPVTCQPESSEDAAALFCALYALAVAVLCAALLAHQCYLVTQGETGSERRRRLPARFGGGPLRNWRLFLAGRRPHERAAGEEDQKRRCSASAAAVAHA